MALYSDLEFWLVYQLYLSLHMLAHHQEHKLRLLIIYWKTMQSQEGACWKGTKHCFHYIQFAKAHHRVSHILREEKQGPSLDGRVTKSYCKDHTYEMEGTIAPVLAICHKETCVGRQVRVFVSQLCPSLCDSMDYSPPGSSVHGVLQERILEWVKIPFSRGSSQPKD